jgi:TolB protein
VTSFFTRFSLSALLLALALPVARGQVTVPVSTLPRVAVGIDGANGAALTQIVSADLRHTGEISPVAAIVNSADFGASGQGVAGGISGQLINHRTGETVFSQTFSGSGRMPAHEFADAITQAVTGHPGFASSKLAFVGAGSGAKELYLGDIDGFNTRAITHDGTISASPALSRDGTKLAYTSYKSGYPDVYLIDLASGQRSRIAFFPGINSGPSFSPDGSQIALTLSKDGNPEIYTMSISGGDPNRITRTRGSETSPSWSPDGSQLVYSSDDRTGSPQLCISTSQSVGDMDHLVTGNVYCTKPDWSLDGRLIAFTARVGGQFQIGVFSMASRTARLVTTGGGEDPAWTRDSRHLVYAHDGRIMLLDTMTGQSLPIATGIGGAEPTVSR